MSFTDRGLELEGCLSKVTDHGRMVAGLSDEGFPWQASVGLEVLEREQVNEGTTVEVNGLMLEGPVSIARRSRLAETSFLYSGADSATYAVALSSEETQDPTEALVADKTVKEDLKAFLAEFPGNEALAAQAFAEDKTIQDVQLQLAAIDKEALVAVRAQVEQLTADLTAAKEELAALKALDAEAGSPGIGFDGKARQSGGQEKLAPEAPKTPKEAWERSVKLQREFPKLSTYEALCAREGFNPKDGE